MRESNSERTEEELRIEIPNDSNVLAIVGAKSSFNKLKQWIDKLNIRENNQYLCVQSYSEVLDVLYPNWREMDGIDDVFANDPSDPEANYLFRVYVFVVNPPEVDSSSWIWISYEFFNHNRVVVDQENTSTWQPNLLPEYTGHEKSFELTWKEGVEMIQKNINQLVNVIPDADVEAEME